MEIYKNNEKARTEIDNLLMQIAEIEASLGKDSTKKEFTQAKAKQNKLLLSIKSIDSEMYDILEPTKL